jgi:2-dehydro-3-deoxygluconokinase
LSTLLNQYADPDNGVDVATLGEALAVMTPTEPGALRDVDTFQKDIGGAELNVAIALRRLGHASRWAGRLGGDEFGHQALALLHREGVDASHVSTKPDGRTGLYIKERGAAGKLRVQYYRDGSAATSLDVCDVDMPALTQARIVHLTGITAALTPCGQRVVSAVLSEASRGNRLISFDANVRAMLLGGRDARHVIMPALERADVVFFSEQEADLLLGGYDENAMRRAFEKLSAAIIVVHGAWGAMACDHSGTVRSAAFHTTVVDVVGAGDAFVAGFLSGLLRGWPTVDCLRLANACGACAVSVSGDARSMPYAHDAMALLGHVEHVER